MILLFIPGILGGIGCWLGDITVAEYAGAMAWLTFVGGLCRVLGD